jgi:Tfp pilus assembly protein PilF
MAAAVSCRYGNISTMHQAYLGQASAHLSLGETRNAIQSLQRALEREPEFPNL